MQLVVQLAILGLLNQVVKLGAAYNYAFALSALMWAVLRIVKIPIAERYSIVNLTIVALHFQVALLFYFRQPVSKQTTLRSFLIALFSLVLGGAILSNAIPSDKWSVAPSIFFCISGIWVIFSFWFLGKSFAVFPVERGLVTSGPYSLVRHPAYSGEFAMLLIAVVVSGNVWLYLLLVGALVALMFRIIEEEAVLKSNLDYNRYTEKIKYRLIPFVW